MNSQPLEKELHKQAKRRKRTHQKSSKVPNRGAVEEADVRLVGADLVFSCSRKKILSGDLGGGGVAAGGPSLRKMFFGERSIELFKNDYE
jgi:hypothetical protein